MKFGKLIGIIDVRTTSVRFHIFVAGTEKIICVHQAPLQGIYPDIDRCEIDPMALFRTVVECMAVLSRRLERLGASQKDVVAIGITNQSGTIVVWDKKSGRPLSNGLLWSDHRATKTVDDLIESIPDQDKKNVDYLRPLCGLPLSPFFPAVKLRWLKDNETRVKKAMLDGNALFGTLESWILYNLTGAEKGGVHLTDVTNASRTMLMNIETLKWDQKLLEFFDLPESILPEIHLNSSMFGNVVIEEMKDVPITACVSNRSGELIGLNCVQYGKLKASFGRGCSVIYNTGNQPVNSTHGLLTTVGYRISNNVAPTYVLEGHAVSAGDAFVWLRDQMGIINTVNEIESMARMVPNSMDVFFVPAFSGLYTPYWNKNARGLICGLTEETTSQHIVRAALEAVCFQVRDIIEAMKLDHKGDYRKLLISGTMNGNSLFLQLLSDLLGVNVAVSKTTDAAALGAALIAYKHLEPDFNMETALCSCETPTHHTKVLSKYESDLLYLKWKRAVEQSLNWDDNRVNEESFKDVV